MKYVVIKARICEGVYKSFPFSFSGSITHSVAAEMFKSLVMAELPGSKIVAVHSGGFMNLGEVSCSRGSETLNIKSEPANGEGSMEDFTIFTLHDFGGGVLV
jgi:hypothetical protein